MVSPHEALRQDQPCGLGGSEGPLDLVRPPREGLFDEHVLARLQGAPRPLAVQPVRKRDVHGLDARIREQSFIAPVGALDSVLPRVALSPRLVAAGDRDHFHGFALRGAGEDRLVDQRGREQPPGDAHD